MKLLSLNNPKFNKIIIKMLVNMSCNSNLHEVLVENEIFKLLLIINDNNDEIVINTLYIIKNILSSLNKKHTQEFVNSGLYIVMKKVEKENDLKFCILKIIKTVDKLMYNNILKLLS